MDHSAILRTQGANFNFKYMQCPHCFWGSRGCRLSRVRTHISVIRIRAEFVFENLGVPVSQMTAAHFVKNENNVTKHAALGIDLVDPPHSETTEVFN